MKFLPLGSSSHGNAYLVDDGESVLLIECGVSFRRLGQLVRGAGYSVSRLAGCLVSHEHKDHSRCWDKLLEAGVPVYMSHGTMQALGAEGAVPQKGHRAGAVRNSTPGDRRRIGRKPAAVGEAAGGYGMDGRKQ